MKLVTQKSIILFSVQECEVCENKFWNDLFPEQYLICKCLLNKAVIL